MLPMSMPTKRSSTFSIDSLLDKRSPKIFASRRPSEQTSTTANDSFTKFPTSNAFVSIDDIRSPLKLSEGFSRCAIIRGDDKRHETNDTKTSPTKQTIRQNKTNLDSPMFICKRRSPEHETFQQLSKPQSPSAAPIFLTNHHHPPSLVSPPQSCDHKIDSFSSKRSDQFSMGPKIIPEYFDHCSDRQPLPRLPNTRHHPGNNYTSPYFNPHHVSPFHHIGGVVAPFVPHGSCRPDVSYFTWLLSRHGSFINSRIPNSGSDSPFIFPFRKPKRIRTAFSPAQLLQLEEAFGKNHYVVGQERKDLAASLSLTETQVKVWFQNRRTKHKRVQPGEDGSNEHNDDLLTSDDEDDNEDEEEYVDVDSPQSYSPINDNNSDHVSDVNSRSTNQNQRLS